MPVFQAKAPLGGDDGWSRLFWPPLQRAPPSRPLPPSRPQAVSASTFSMSSELPSAALFQGAHWGHLWVDQGLVAALALGPRLGSSHPVQAAATLLSLFWDPL